MNNITTRLRTVRVGFGLFIAMIWSLTTSVCPGADQPTRAPSAGGIGPSPSAGEYVEVAPNIGQGSDRGVTGIFYYKVRVPVRYKKEIKQTIEIRDVVRAYQYDPQTGENKPVLREVVVPQDKTVFVEDVKEIVELRSVILSVPIDLVNKGTPNQYDVPAFLPSRGAAQEPLSVNAIHRVADVPGPAAQPLPVRPLSKAGDPSRDSQDPRPLVPVTLPLPSAARANKTANVAGQISARQCDSPTAVLPAALTNSAINCGWHAATTP